jgi:ATP-binding cassette subfamily F protein 3
MLEKLKPITAPEEAKKVVFTFPKPEELSPPIINLDGVAVGYGGPPVLRRLNLRIDQDDRIALLGRNGEGKSTLSKLLAGKLQPSEGKLNRSSKLRIGYFAQHQVDELDIWTRRRCNTSCACARRGPGRSCAPGWRALA